MKNGFKVFLGFAAGAAAGYLAAKNSEKLSAYFDEICYKIDDLRDQLNDYRARLDSEDECDCCGCACEDDCDNCPCEDDCTECDCEDCDDYFECDCDCDCCDCDDDDDESIEVEIITEADEAAEEAVEAAEEAAEETAE